MSNTTTSPIDIPPPKNKSVFVADGTTTEMAMSASVEPEEDVELQESYEYCDSALCQKLASHAIGSDAVIEEAGDLPSSSGSADKAWKINATIMGKLSPTDIINFASQHTCKCTGKALTPPISVSPVPTSVSPALPLPSSLSVGNSAKGSQNSTPENLRKKVMVQVPSGHKMKPARPQAFKKAKQPNVTKAIEQCRSNKTDFLDFSSYSLHQLPPLKDLPHLRSLLLYDNKLTELPKGIGDLAALEQLLIHQNTIQCSGLSEELTRCSKLTVLDLRHNRIEQLPSRPIFELPSLEHLFVSFNKLTELSPDIGKAKTLKVLIISRNSLKSPIPSTIGLLTNLHTLDLSYNNLETLPDEIGQCVSLKDLKLQHNRLTALPETIGELKELVRLGIKYNHLVAIPASLANCTKLDEFNIENNSVKTLPESLLAKLPNIKTITLSRNSFTAFPPGGPAQFSKITTLNFDHNLIDGVPVGIFSSATNLSKLKLTENEITSLFPHDLETDWKSLVELDLGSNQLRTLPPEIQHLTKLEVLRLNYNQVRTIPPELCQLTALQLLDLESNQIECLPSEISGLQQLVELNVVSNQLTTFPSSIGQLTKLKVIRAGDNKIKQLPIEIGNMSGLTDLFLNDNEDLDNLPVELSQCSSLRILNLERCPLRDLPVQVVSGGSAMIIFFLQQVVIFRNSRTNL